MTDSPAAPAKSEVAEDKKPFKGFRFKVHGETYELPFHNGTLVLSDQMELEAYFDLPYTEIDKQGWLSSARCTAFMAYLAMKKKEPAVTFEYVCSSAEIEVHEIERPTSAPASSGSPSSAK